jgi:DNA-binding NarL/FixJ family response regulator
MQLDRPEISILVASKRTVVCQLYSQALNRHAKFRVVAQAGSSSEILQAIENTTVDVALISTILGNGPLDSIAVLQQIRASRPKVRSVLLFDREETQLVVPAFRAGARGVFCVENDDFRRLCRCVTCVHAGQVWAKSSELCQLLDALSHPPVTALVDARGDSLVTKREQSIVHLVQEGFTNREIAHELHLSEHTVRNYLFRIFNKLGVSNRVELALYAVNDSTRANLESICVREGSKQMELSNLRAL